MLKNDIEKVLVSEDELQAIVTRLGKKIKEDYEGVDDIVVVGILRGASIFMADLVRALDRHVILEFMDVSSYGDATESSGEVKIIKDLDSSVENKHVLIVEDIIDTGRTLNYLVNLFKYRKAASVKICSLLDKPDRRVVKEITPDYIGTEVPDEFVVGYGLDFIQRYRNLPYIGVLKSKVYEHLIK